MKIVKFIPIKDLCVNYNIDVSFFNQLHEIGLIEIITYKKAPCISMETINEVEKMIRMHHDLNVNIPGIDVALNLLNKIEKMNSELISLKNKLRLYEDDF